MKNAFVAQDVERDMERENPDPYMPDPPPVKASTDIPSPATDISDDLLVTVRNRSAFQKVAGIIDSPEEARRQGRASVQDI